MDKQQVDTVFFGPMTGELGWACSRWHAWCRFRRFVEFGNCRAIAMDYDWRYPLYADFVDEFLPLPEWVTSLGWEQDCYELVPPDSPAGGVMPNEVYHQLISFCAQFYNQSTTWVVRPPRGYNLIVQQAYQQMWKALEPSEAAGAYADSLLHNASKPVLVFSGRKRARAQNRNIPEATWEILIDELVKMFTVVITGTTHSSSLVHKVGRDIINVIPRTGVDGLDVLIALLKRATLSVTSQSGPTLVSLLCETPSYIVGHEGKRHSQEENFLDTACMFRPVPEYYAALEPEVMLVDILNFATSLQHEDQNVNSLYQMAHTETRAVMVNLMEDQNVDYHEVDLKGLQQEVINADAR